MKLYGQRIFVDDLDAARLFYGETLGLPQLWDWGSVIGYDVGVTLMIELEHLRRGRGVRRRPLHRLLARRRDIDETYRTLSAKAVTFLAPPEAMPWGGTLAHFRDPAGNVLTLLGEPT
jgi:catechol 2,3-dioxygenase-like lactoylglutathione lyase family enzyme